MFLWTVCPPDIREAVLVYIKGCLHKFHQLILASWEIYVLESSTANSIDLWDCRNMAMQGVSVKSCSYYYGGIRFQNKSTSSGHVWVNY